MRHFKEKHRGSTHRGRPDQSESTRASHKRRNRELDRRGSRERASASRDGFEGREGSRGGGDRDFGRHRRRLKEGRKGGRGRHRMFEGDELRLVLLSLMETEPRHGYDLIREIETRTGGTYAPSPGIVYPTLTFLVELGQTEERASDGVKKLYGITPAGLAWLAEHRSVAEAALARLDALARQGEALDTGPVFRAMSNLKAALRQRLATQPDKELLFAVADAIDEAARKVERL